MTDSRFDNEEDWEKRILCSDESCIGVIGADGKCKECGRIYEGKCSNEKVTGSPHGESAEEQKTVPSENSECDDDWDKRILCGDESCIGVIGADGKCKECGKPLS